MSTRFAAKALFASLGAVAALVTVAAAVPAQAAAAEGQSRVVRYGDLDLTTESGATTLKRRVANAATAVCGGSDRAPLSIVVARQACRGAAIASAAPQLQILFAQADRGERFAEAGGVTVAAD